MSNFRLGPNMFDKIPLDWLVLTTDGGSRLIAHAVTTRIDWTGETRDLPRGWQGVVRHSYENSVGRQNRCNALVGLFVKVEDHYSGQGWAAQVVGLMKVLGQRAGLSALIIPLRLPMRYERQYADMPFDTFAGLKQQDGQYLDYWLRLHVRLGAEIIGHCETSHQYAMHLDDFYKQFACERLHTSGHHLVRQREEWHRAFVDVEREFALINHGCVWVQHRLS